MVNINNLRDINKALQNWINIERSKGHNVTQQEIERHRSELIQVYNNQPNPTCHGFTLDQMDYMRYTPFEEECPIKLRHLTEEEISQIPIMRQILHLMNSLAEKELKLTVTDKIPIKMVNELYELGVKSWDSDYFQKKIRFTEERCDEVFVVRAVLDKAGLIKKRLGKMSLTARGKKILKDHNELLKIILISFMSDLNIDHSHVYIPSTGVEWENSCLLYSLWLLHHYGSEWRNVNRYASDYFRALDIRGNMSKYTCNTFERIFRIIGLCEIRELDKKYQEGETVKNYYEVEVRKTPLVDMMFSFEEPAKI